VQRSDAPIAWIERWFEDRRPAFQAVLDLIGGHAAVLADFGTNPPPEPRFGQDWFPGLDGAAAYALVRAGRPAWILEIGSGHSTRFLARAVADEGIDCDIHCIDPAPRADITRLPVTLHATVLGDLAPSALPTVASGDVLFVDSSHLALPGRDVERIFGEILPSLPAGILVHVHDILLPDPYPEAWAWRGYNEQGLVAALLGGGGYKVVFASYFTRTRLADRLENSVMARLALPSGALETSLWLRKIAPAM
jgi:hypothetical protein